ncbi:hypothetical protein Holit_02352 [Hollandina sp. SP2]
MKNIIIGFLAVCLLFFVYRYGKMNGKNEGSDNTSVTVDLKNHSDADQYPQNRSKQEVYPDQKGPPQNGNAGQKKDAYQQYKNWVEWNEMVENYNDMVLSTDDVLARSLFQPMQPPPAPDFSQPAPSPQNTYQPVPGQHNQYFVDPNIYNQMMNQDIFAPWYTGTGTESSSAADTARLKRAEKQLEDSKRLYNTTTSVTMKPFIAQQIREQEALIEKLRGY